MIEKLWEGESVAARLARRLLTPLELAYAAVSGTRGLLYDAGVLRARATAVPSISVGNLTVGGTGKTPFAAWLAAELRARGARPSVVLRGYGDDEPLVHRALNPTIPVIVAPDRVAASEDARRLGCDIAVLDDAFQHRRAARIADVVLVSADQWRENAHLLPAGPWREPIRAVRRATIVVVTRKAVAQERAAAIARVVARVAPAVPIALVHIAPVELRRVGAGDEVRQPIDSVAGETVLAISAIGDPEAFHAQLQQRGARVVPAAFRDHHRYTPADVASLAERASTGDAAGVKGGGQGARAVCTLKDAVKLAALWPAAPALWYVSQRVTVERGGDALELVFTAARNARAASDHLRRPGFSGSTA